MSHCLTHSCSNLTDICEKKSFILNRQPGKALPYYLKLRRPGVFDLIRDNNLFTDVQDQALLLIEFDQDMQLIKKRSSKDGTNPALPGTIFPQQIIEDGETSRHGTAITLLIEHTQSIPVRLSAFLSSSSVDCLPECERFLVLYSNYPRIANICSCILMRCLIKILIWPSITVIYKCALCHFMSSKRVLTLNSTTGAAVCAI